MAVPKADEADLIVLVAMLDATDAKEKLEVLLVKVLPPGPFSEPVLLPRPFSGLGTVVPPSLLGADSAITS